MTSKRGREGQMIRRMAGISLIELMVTVVVIAVGMTALVKFHGKVIKTNAIANQRNEAINMAQAKLEELRTFDAVEDGVGVTAAYASIVTGSDDIDMANTSYEREWTITEDATAGYKTINVQVSWTGQDNSDQSVDVETVVAAYEPGSMDDIIQVPEEPITPSDGGGDEADRNEAIPEAAVDNGDGTSDYTTDEGDVLTYDNESGDVTEINDNTARTVSGTVSIGAGPDKPTGNPGLDELNITASDVSGDSYCTYSDDGTYTCIVNDGWEGYILVDYGSAGEVCTGTSHSYESAVTYTVTGDLTSQNHTLIKSGRSCSGVSMSLHQTL